MLCGQDVLLKLRAKIQANHTERETHIVSLKECQNFVGNGVNLNTRRRDRIRKGGFDNVLGRDTRLGDQNRQIFAGLDRLTRTQPLRTAFPEVKCWVFLFCPSV
jgi:hypothetical protein